MVASQQVPGRQAIAAMGPWVWRTEMSPVRIPLGGRDEHSSNSLPHSGCKPAGRIVWGKNSPPVGQPSARGQEVWRGYLQPSPTTRPIPAQPPGCLLDPSAEAAPYPLTPTTPVALSHTFAAIRPLAATRPPAPSRVPGATPPLPALPLPHPSDSVVQKPCPTPTPLGTGPTPHTLVLSCRDSSIPCGPS